MSEAVQVVDAQVFKIPLSKLLANEDQPRHRFRLFSIRQMADSLTSLGQLTDLKVRPLTEQEKASYSKWDVIAFGSNMPPNVLTFGQQGYEYLVIGGHRRLAGAQLAGFETLNCKVLNIAPEDTHLASLMDNSLEEMDWWDWDLAIEAESKAFPNMTVRQLAKRLGVSKSKVGKALILAKVLNEDSRRMIGNHLDPTCDNDGFPVDLPAEDTDDEDDFVPPRDKNIPADPSPGASGQSEPHLVPRRDNIKSDYQITEAILLTLAGLEDPHDIEFVIEIILNKELPLVQVKKMVEWVNSGNDMYDFEPQAGSKDKPKEEDPLAEAWKGLGPGIKVKHKGGEDYEIHLTVTGGDKALKTARAAQKAVQGRIF